MFSCCCVQDKDSELVDLHISSAVSPDEVNSGDVLLLSEFADSRTLVHDSKQPEQSYPQLLSVPKIHRPPSAQVPIIETYMGKTHRPRGKDFKIPLLKPYKSSPIGLELDTVGGACGMVMSIVDGAVGIYNNVATPELQVRPGDFIMGVNGTMGNTAAMSRLASDNISLDLHFRRPEEYIVSIRRMGTLGETLGLELEYTGIGKTLLIAGISDGLANEWNRGVHPDNQIMIHDRIVEVNAYRGDAKRLLEMCSKSKELVLTILRVRVNKSWL